MRSCPLEDDEDWGLDSDSEGLEGPELRQAGGPLRCWQKAGLKRLIIDDRHPPKVRPARYDTGPRCAVCGRFPTPEQPLAPLFDNTSFVSMAEIVRDVVGLEFAVSENPHENVICDGCRGHVLALHTMRGWLCALQKRFVLMVVCTNTGRRSAKLRVPKAYRGVDFFSREAPMIDHPQPGSARLENLNSATHGEMGSGDALADGLGSESGVTSESVSAQEGEAMVQTESVSQGVVAERDLGGSEPRPVSGADRSVVNGDTADQCAVRQLLGTVASTVPEPVPPGDGSRPPETSVSETEVTTFSPVQPLESLQAPQSEPKTQPPLPAPQQAIQTQPSQQQPAQSLHPLQLLQPPSPPPPAQQTVQPPLLQQQPAQSLQTLQPLQPPSPPPPAQQTVQPPPQHQQPAQPLQTLQPLQPVEPPPVSVRPSPPPALPSASSSQPPVFVLQPASSVSQPAASVSQATWSVSQPIASVSQPTASVWRPTGSVSQPPASVSQPTGSVSQPIASVSQPLLVTQPAASTSPATPPRPSASVAAAPAGAAAQSATGGGDSGLLDPFEECSISDLLVLRSPLSARAPPVLERPPPARLKKIAPKVDGRGLPAPIVLNIMSLPAAVSTASSPGFKAIVPRQPASDRVPALRPLPALPASAPAGERGRRAPRRLPSARDSRRPRPAPEIEPPPQDAAACPEPMVFYNPDGSIPAPPYSGQAGRAGEQAQLQTERLDPPPPPAPGAGGYRTEAACEVPHEEVERYAVRYEVYSDEPVLTQQRQAQNQPQPHQGQLQPQHQQQGQSQHVQQLHQERQVPTLVPVSATGSFSAPNAHQVEVEGGRDPVYRVLPRICKLCGKAIGNGMHMLRKHFVESHMNLERNDLTGGIVYRCRACAAESTSLESLKKHFATRHVSRSALVCGRCDEPFPRLEALQYHLRRRHPGRPQCPECGLSFLSSRALSIHVSKAHQTEISPKQLESCLPVLPPPPVAGEVTIGTS